MTKNLLIKPFIIIVSALLFIGCQSTPEIEPDKSQPIHAEIYQPSIDINVSNNIPSPDLAITHEETKLPLAKPINHKANYFEASAAPFKKTVTDINKAVCRDNVAVTYRVTDQNGVKGVYNATVQAQGIIIAISHDKKQIKVKSTGWFSDNVNLQNWQPFLTSVPLAEGLLLNVGGHFWDKKSHWYLCGGLKS